MVLIVHSVANTINLELEKNGMCLFMITYNIKFVELGIPKNSDSELAQVNRYFVLYTLGRYNTRVLVLISIEH